MKKRNVIIAMLGILFLVSCGPRRYRCGPNRRCDIKHNTIKAPLFNKIENKSFQNS